MANKYLIRLYFLKVIARMDTPKYDETRRDT